MNKKKTMIEVNPSNAVWMSIIIKFYGYLFYTCLAKQIVGNKSRILNVGTQKRSSDSGVYHKIMKRTY